MKKVLVAAAMLTLVGNPAFAHVSPVEHGSFSAGFLHPLSGADHILAIVTVGLLASMLGGRAMFTVPAAFIGTMLLGFGAALAGVPMFFVEPVVLASVTVLGLLVALAVPVSAATAAIIAGFFAFFHGHAHGSEIGGAAAFPYGAGFALATAGLHLAGLGIGLAIGRAMAAQNGRLAMRLAGGVAAVAGLIMIAQ